MNHSSATPRGTNSTEAEDNKHQAKTSGSAARFSNRFHDEWASAANNTRNRDSAVMGGSIASGPTTPVFPLIGRPYGDTSGG